MDNTQRPAARAVYIISVAAELAGVHPQTLRIYERKGLVQPARTDGGSRRYSDADIAQLQRIQELTDEGLNLAGVKRVLELEGEVARLQAELAQLTADGRAAMAEADQRRREEVAEVERQHRAELVPVSQSLTLYRRRR
jgi:MerR family transcriptional regulator/heat shock protein HspR